MRNLKKGLALVLVLAMAASTFVTGAFNDVAKDHTNATAVGVLNDLGVLTGKTETTFAPAATLTRAEAAAVIYRLLSGKTNADNFAGATSFTDVAASFWGAGFVNFCVSEEIIMGYPDKSFKPDAPVTYAEFTTMLVRAAGLEEKRTISKIDDNGNVVEATVVDTKYPSGYIAIAAKNGMNDDVNLMANDAADRGNVAQMAYNTLFNTITSSGRTLAENVFKVKNAYGVLTADLDGKPDGTFKDAKTGGNTVTFDGKKKFDIKSELIGLNVKIMYKEPTTGSKEIVSIVAMDNTAYEVASKDLEFTTGAARENLTYTFKVNGKNKTFKVAADAAVILNGEALSDTPTDKALAAAKKIPAAKTNLPITYTFIITGDKNDVINTIKIDETIYGKVTAMTAKSMTIETIGEVFAPEYITVSLEDDVVVGTGVAQDKRVTLKTKTTTNDGTKVSAGTVSLVEKQTGFVSSKVDKKYTIGGTVYTAARDVAGDKDVAIDMGKTIEFYAVNGFVVESKATTESGKYAYVTASEKTMGAEGRVYAYLSDGTKGTFDIDSNSELKVAADGKVGDELLTANSLFAYSLTSAGKIKLELVGSTKVPTAVGADITDYQKDSKIINKTDYVSDSSIIFVLDGEKVKVLKGQLPGFTKKITSSSKDYQYVANTKANGQLNEIKVAVILGAADTFSGVTSQSEIYGMVSGSYEVESTYEDGATKFRVKMTVAADGDAAKTFYTAWEDSMGDGAIPKAIADNAGKGAIVKLELATNGAVDKVTVLAKGNNAEGSVVASFVNNTLTTGVLNAGKTAFEASTLESKVLKSDVQIYQVTRKSTGGFDSIAVASTGALIKATVDGGVVHGCNVSYILDGDKMSVIFVDAQELLTTAD